MKGEIIMNEIIKNFESEHGVDIRMQENEELQVMELRMHGKRGGKYGATELIVRRIPLASESDDILKTLNAMLQDMLDRKEAASHERFEVLMAVSNFGKEHGVIVGYQWLPQRQQLVTAIVNQREKKWEEAVLTGEESPEQVVEILEGILKKMEAAGEAKEEA